MPVLSLRSVADIQESVYHLDVKGEGVGTERKKTVLFKYDR